MQESKLQLILRARGAVRKVRFPAIMILTVAASIGLLAFVLLPRVSDVRLSAEKEADALDAMNRALIDLKGTHECWTDVQKPVSEDQGGANDETESIRAVLAVVCVGDLHAKHTRRRSRLLRQLKDIQCGRTGYNVELHVIPCAHEYGRGLTKETVESVQIRLEKPDCTVGGVNCAQAWVVFLPPNAVDIPLEAVSSMVPPPGEKVGYGSNRLRMNVGLTTVLGSNDEEAHLQYCGAKKCHAANDESIDRGEVLAFPSFTAIANVPLPACRGSGKLKSQCSLPKPAGLGTVSPWPPFFFGDDGQPGPVAAPLALAEGFISVPAALISSSEEQLAQHAATFQKAHRLSAATAITGLEDMFDCGICHLILRSWKYGEGAWLRPETSVAVYMPATKWKQAHTELTGRASTRWGSFLKSYGGRPIIAISAGEIPDSGM